MNGGLAWAWRAGERPPHPAPDGRRYALTGPTRWPVMARVTSLRRGVARPWFVDDAGSFSSQAVIPPSCSKANTTLFTAGAAADHRFEGLRGSFRPHRWIPRSVEGVRCAVARHARGRTAPLGSRFGSSAPEMPWMWCPDDAWCDAFEARVASLWEELRQEDRTRRPVHHTPRRTRITAGGAFLRGRIRTR